MRVGAMVRQLVGSCSGVMHAARLGAVVKAVEGIVQGGRLSPATMGRNLRLFLLLAMAHRLLRGWDRPIILVDWTQAGSSTHQALVAAVPIGGRALPIFLEVHPQ